MVEGQQTPGTAELRCSCGYLLQGLTEKRCPECGRSIPSKPRRKKPYLLKGFLWGFGILAVPSLVLAMWGQVRIWFVDLGTGEAADLEEGLMIGFGSAGLVVSVVTGLIGMLIGYVIYRTQAVHKNPL